MGHCGGWGYVVIMYAREHSMGPPLHLAHLYSFGSGNDYLWCLHAGQKLDLLNPPTLYNIWQWLRLACVALVGTQKSVWQGYMEGEFVRSCRHKDVSSQTRQRAM